MIKFFFLSCIVYLALAQSSNWFLSRPGVPSCGTARLIRRAYGDLTDAQKSIYARTVFQMSRRRGAYVSGTSSQIALYDAFQGIHASSWNGMFHSTSAFAPHHKAYLHMYESAMRYTALVDGPTMSPPITQAQACALTLPYWEWDAAYAGGGTWNLLTSDLFETTLMGDSTPQASTFFVDAGLFAYNSGFKPVGSELRRRLSNPSLPTSFNYRSWIQNSLTFSAFSGLIHSNLHGFIHTWVGFQMGATSTAAEDPIFYMHHCNVDRLWHLWMDCQGFDNVTPSTVTSAMYIAQNPIGSGTPKRDPNGNNFLVGLDNQVWFYYQSSTLVFLPMSQWPTIRQLFPMGPNGWLGLNYRYGPDKLVPQLTTCPNKVWTMVNQNS
jgi:tyrosinase